MIGLLINFGEDKTILILFARKRKIKNIKKLHKEYKEIEIKQHLQVTHLGDVLVLPL